MGRAPSPVGYHTESLMELASSYFARAAEMTMIIQRLERDGQVVKGSAAYKFRTGELRTFMDLAKASTELGSRRITLARLEFDKQNEGIIP
jgi:hypothetical protein